MKHRGWISALAAIVGCALCAPAAANIGMICTEDLGPSPVFDLKATDGRIITPDGNAPYMWGFALDDLDGATPDFQAPGPVLCVQEGADVTINLTNNLTEAVSVVFPGQSAVSAVETAAPTSTGVLTLQAEPGGAVSYSFTATDPGTYLYESGTQPHKQIHMGLYGVLVVRPAMGTSFAYNDASTEFSDEFLLVLHEVDPVLHRDVELGNAFDHTTRHDRYWTINGRSMPDVINDNFFPLMPAQPYSALVRVEAHDPDTNPSSETNPTGPALPILIRYANAGSVNHPFHPHGDHLATIAQDGRLLGSASIESFTRTIAAGQTYDLLFSWTNVENWKICVTPGGAPCPAGGPGDDPGAGPIPVAIPGLLNIVFKDDVTFYSGDEHLGFEGTLPAAVTTFSECGELYFPWHSHALHTVQNFDEGFGGMLTLVRIDPPGGCP